MSTVTIYSNGDNIFYKNGVLHRTDGPALEMVNKYKKWFKNGQLHRTDGPEIEYPNGEKWWYKNGVLEKIN
jgi:hypothetical protein